MKRSLCIGTNVFLLIFSLAIVSGGFARAQAAPEAQPAATATSYLQPERAGTFRINGSNTGS